MGDVVSGIGSAVGGLFGGAGDALGLNGSSYNAASAHILNPVSEDQANTAYGQTQQGLAQQQAFVNALQAQNGIGNQSDVYNRLSGVANGTGPNPAQAALNQATQANIANQAALMAGQRGAGANTGLLARQAAQQGGALQQQAAGQGATMQAQQALNALNMQGGLATQQVGQQAAANNAYNQAAQSQQQNLLNSIAQQNNANVNMTSNRNNVGGQLQQQKVQGQQNMQGGVMQGIGSLVGGLFAHGGMVKNYDVGGDVSATGTATIPSISALVQPTADKNAPKSNVGKYHQAKDSGEMPFSNIGNQTQGGQSLQNGSRTMVTGLGNLANGLFGSSNSQDADSGITGGSAMAGGPMDAGSAGSDIMMAAKGGKVPAMVSPGEVYLPPKKAKEVAEKKASPMSGEHIPGKAKVKGDSLKNDTVPKTLEAGGIVIPRSIMEAKDAEKKAAAFVRAHLAKHRGQLPQKE